MTRFDTMLLIMVMMLATLAPVRAQLLKPNSEGLSMGLVLLNVTDVQAHRKFWVDEFDAKQRQVLGKAVVQLAGQPFPLL